MEKKLSFLLPTGNKSHLGYNSKSFLKSPLPITIIFFPQEVYFLICFSWITSNICLIFRAALISFLKKEMLSSRMRRRIRRWCRGTRPCRSRSVGTGRTRPCRRTRRSRRAGRDRPSGVATQGRRTRGRQLLQESIGGGEKNISNYT